MWRGFACRCSMCEVQLTLDIYFYFLIRNFVFLDHYKDFWKGLGGKNLDYLIFQDDETSK